MKPDERKNDSIVPTATKAHAQPIIVRNILAAIDFSDASKLVLDYASILAEKLQAKITLIHVVEPMINPGTLAVTTEPEVDMRIVRERQDLLESLRLNSINPGIPSEVVVKTGVPAEQIIDEAVSLRSQLIITASHGHSALQDVLLGNTAERVVRHARCSVLTVRRATAGHGARTALPVCFKRILVPVDFSIASETALALAAELAKLFDATIVIEHVVEASVFQVAHGQIPRKVKAADPERVVCQLGQRFVPPVIPREIVVRVGQPFKAIVESAETLQVDLIFLAAHGHKVLKWTLLGRTAERVVRHAPCAVWTLRG